MDENMSEDLIWTIEQVEIYLEAYPEYAEDSNRTYG